MAKRTIEDFRAEYGVWQNELAERLGIEQAQLEAAEQAETAPEELAEKIIRLYSLPGDYFTFDPSARELRFTPKRPFLYFAGVCVVWFAALNFILALISFPNIIISVLHPESQSVLLDLLTEFCSTAVYIFSGIYLTSFIIKKTSYSPSIRKYDYFIPCLSVFLLQAVVVLTPAVRTDDGNIILYSLATLPFELLSVLCCALFLYFFLTATGKKQKTGLYIIFALPTASYLIYFVSLFFYETPVHTFISCAATLFLLILQIPVLILSLKKESKLLNAAAAALPALSILTPAAAVAVITLI